MDAATTLEKGEGRPRKAKKYLAASTTGSTFSETTTGSTWQSTGATSPGITVISQSITAAATSTPPPIVGNRHNNKGRIAGAVVGGVVGLALFVGALFWLWRLRRARQDQGAEEGNGQIPYEHSPHVLMEGHVVEKYRHVGEAAELPHSPAELPAGRTAERSELPSPKGRSESPGQVDSKEVSG
jgi:hypothetical protein